MKNYVELTVSRNADYSNPTELLKSSIDFIQDWSSSRPSVYILEGRSGAGKS